MVRIIIYFIILLLLDIIIIFKPLNNTHVTVFVRRIQPCIQYFIFNTFVLSLQRPATKSIFNMTDHKMIHYTPPSTFQGIIL